MAFCFMAFHSIPWHSCTMLILFQTHSVMSSYVATLLPGKGEGDSTSYLRTPHFLYTSLYRLTQLCLFPLAKCLCLQQSVLRQTSHCCKLLWEVNAIIKAVVCIKCTYIVRSINLPVAWSLTSNSNTIHFRISFQRGLAGRNQVLKSKT